MTEENRQSSKGGYYTIAPTQPLTINKTPVSTSDDSPILMEARLSETITSLHQLISTNSQLDEILKDEVDEDLLQALIENDALILRKMEEVRVMRRKLIEAGVQMNLDVPVYCGSSVLKERQKEQNDGGVYL